MGTHYCRRAGEKEREATQCMAEGERNSDRDGAKGKATKGRSDRGTKGTWEGKGWDNARIDEPSL